jgi:hypothetical protein
VKPFYREVRGRTQVSLVPGDVCCYYILGCKNRVTLELMAEVDSSKTPFHLGLLDTSACAWASSKLISTFCSARRTYACTYSAPCIQAIVLRTRLRLRGESEELLGPGGGAGRPGACVLCPVCNILAAGRYRYWILGAGCWVCWVAVAGGRVA